MPNVLQTLRRGVTIVLNVKWKPLCCWLPSGWVCWTKAIKQEPASDVGPEVVETPQVSYRCNCCAKVETQVPFQRSSQCQAIWYCSWSCLKELWPDQIIICQAIKELSQRVFTLQTAFIILLTPTQWPQMGKFSQLLQAGKTVAFDFSHHGHALVTLYVQFLCSDWSKFDRWVHAENLCSILNLVYFDSWSWQSFVSTCDVFNCLFLLDVQNEIHLLSRSPLLFMASLFIGFLVEKYVACQSRKSDFGWHRFRFSPCFMGIKESSQFSSDSGVTW